MLPVLDENKSFCLVFAFVLDCSENLRASAIFSKSCALDSPKSSKAPDLIKNIRVKTNATIIGFALETENGEDNAKQKMKNKGLDYIVLNYANEENAGFEVNTNHVIIFTKNGSKKELTLDRKDRISSQLINYIINNK